MKKDLHIHTIHSDGEKTVSQIVEKVKLAGVREFAITDHDTIGGDIELKSNEKHFWHISHWNGFSPEWTNWCLRNFELSKNFLPHCGHV